MKEKKGRKLCRRVFITRLLPAGLFTLAQACLHFSASTESKNREKQEKTTSRWQEASHYRNLAG